MPIEIGKLEPIDIREVWPTEPRMTRWLEENADVLSDTLGFELSSLASERATDQRPASLISSRQSICQEPLHEENKIAKWGG